VATQLAQMAVLTTDLVMLGRLGEKPLASAAIGNSLYYFAWLVCVGPAAATAPMLAHIVGLKRTQRALVRRTVHMSLWALAILALPLTVLLTRAELILRSLGQDPILSAGAGVFVHWLCLGLIFSAGFQALRNFATVLGRPRGPLWVMAATILYNFIADYALIFGHFGFPRLGLAGSGIATSSSAAFSFLAMAGVIAIDPRLNTYGVFRRFWIPAKAQLAEAFRLGLPIAVTMIFEAMLFNASTLVMGTLGTVPTAAHQVALNFSSLTFMIGLGIAMAATVRVGLASGCADLSGARMAGFTAMGVATGCAIVCGVIMVFAGKQIAAVYLDVQDAKSAEVIMMAASFLKVAAAFQLFDALQAVGSFSLRGLKDARAPMVLAGCAYWLTGAPAGLVLAFGLRLGGLGVWIGLAVGLAVAAAAMLVRFLILTRPRPQ
jgi:MATE family multidrug resistance protein